MDLERRQTGCVSDVAWGEGFSAKALGRTDEMRSLKMEMVMSLQSTLQKLPLAYIAGASGGRDCVLQFNLSSPVQITIAADQCSVSHDAMVVPDVELTMSDDVFVELMRGQINGVMGVMSGKIGVEGDIGLARQALDFFDASKLD